MYLILSTDSLARNANKGIYIRKFPRKPNCLIMLYDSQNGERHQYLLICRVHKRSQSIDSPPFSRTLFGFHCKIWNCFYSFNASVSLSRLLRISHWSDSQTNYVHILLSRCVGGWIGRWKVASSAMVSFFRVLCKQWREMCVYPLDCRK